MDERARGTLEPAQAETRLLILCVGAVVAAAVLTWSGSDAYRFVLGEANPVAATLVISILGLLALRVLMRSGWFEVGGGTGEGYRFAAVTGVALTIPVIVLDGLGGFPIDLNVSWPTSLLFYPAIALVAEFVFHAGPLALAALASDRVSMRGDDGRRLGLFVALTIEPAIQVWWGVTHSPTWVNAYVGLHLLAFNAIGLHLFRRYGFMTMYLYRVAYYAIWHVAWGHVRLGMLF